jgi:biotin-dependent carboxylase-like uncharacterized protein
MDLATLDTLNALLGNDRSCAAIEWALTAGEIEFTDAATFAVGGAHGDLSLAGREIGEWRAYDAHAGEVLAVGAPKVGRFRYIVFSGGIECAPVLGSRSTYVPGGFGGLEGRRLRSGDSFAAGGRTRRHQVSDALPASLRPADATDIRFIPRSEGIADGEWTVSRASDRTGYRLETTREMTGGTVTSEPVCPGTIQLPPGGEAIVLMADAPTVGGYHIAGGVISADLGALAQRAPAETIRLLPVTPYQAQRAIEREAERLERVREWSLTA